MDSHRSGKRIRRPPWCRNPWRRRWGAIGDRLCAWYHRAGSAGAGEQSLLAARDLYADGPPPPCAYRRHLRRFGAVGLMERSWVETGGASDPDRLLEVWVQAPGTPGVRDERLPPDEVRAAATRWLLLLQADAVPHDELHHLSRQIAFCMAWDHADWSPQAGLDCACVLRGAVRAGLMTREQARHHAPPSADTP